MNCRLPHVLAALAASLCCAHAAAGPQAFVSSNGSDGARRAGCPDNRPCRTFAVAMNVVNSGGEVIAVDPGDYGPVTITKSVTLVGNGYAHIVAPSGAPAIAIATPDIDVAVRGLTITGPGPTGISMTGGRSLSVENCVISAVTTGVDVNTAARVRIVNGMVRHANTGVRIAGGASAEVVSTQFFHNQSYGLSVDGNTAGTTKVSVSDSVAADGLTGFGVIANNAAGVGRLSIIRSTAANNTYGFASVAGAGSAIITVGSSMASGNQFGLAMIPGVVGLTTPVFESMGDNTVRQNVNDSNGIITPVSPM